MSIYICKCVSFMFVGWVVVHVGLYQPMSCMYVYDVYI
jgi:hypothetical protein